MTARNRDDASASVLGGDEASFRRKLRDSMRPDAPTPANTQSAAQRQHDSVTLDQPTSAHPSERLRNYRDSMASSGPSSAYPMAGRPTKRQSMLSETRSSARYPPRPQGGHHGMASANSGHRLPATRQKPANRNSIMSLKRMNSTDSRPNSMMSAYSRFSLFSSAGMHPTRIMRARVNCVNKKFELTDAQRQQLQQQGKRTEKHRLLMQKQHEAFAEKLTELQRHIGEEDEDALRLYREINDMLSGLKHKVGKLWDSYGSTQEKQAKARYASEHYIEVVKEVEQSVDQCMRQLTGADVSWEDDEDEAAHDVELAETDEATQKREEAKKDGGQARQIGVDLTREIQEHLASQSATTSEALRGEDDPLHDLPSLDEQKVTRLPAAYGATGEWGAGLAGLSRRTRRHARRATTNSSSSGGWAKVRQGPVQQLAERGGHPQDAVLSPKFAESQPQVSAKVPSAESEESALPSNMQRLSWRGSGRSSATDQMHKTGEDSTTSSPGPKPSLPSKATQPEKADVGFSAMTNSLFARDGRYLKRASLSPTVRSISSDGPRMNFGLSLQDELGSGGFSSSQATTSAGSAALSLDVPGQQAIPRCVGPVMSAVSAIEARGRGNIVRDYQRQRTASEGAVNTRFGLPGPPSAAHRPASPLLSAESWGGMPSWMLWQNLEGLESENSFDMEADMVGVLGESSDLAEDAWSDDEGIDSTRVPIPPSPTGSGGGDISQRGPRKPIVPPVVEGTQWSDVDVLSLVLGQLSPWWNLLHCLLAVVVINPLCDNLALLLELRAWLRWHLLGKMSFWTRPEPWQIRLASRSLKIVLTHCCMLLTAQVWIASTREREKWLRANGETRAYLISRIYEDPSTLLLPGVDPKLMLGAPAAASVVMGVMHFVEEVLLPKLGPLYFDFVLSVAPIFLFV